MSDLALKLVDNCINIGLNSEGSALERDDGLETSVLISLFTDQRVAKSETPDGALSQRGWWGDEFLENTGDKIGSKIWTFLRGKSLNDTASAIRVRAEQSLKWLIDDGVASTVAVVTSIEPDKSIKIEIKIKRPNEENENIYAVYWDGQALKSNA